MTYFSDSFPARRKALVDLYAATTGPKQAKVEAVRAALGAQFGETPTFYQVAHEVRKARKEGLLTDGIPTSPKQQETACLVLTDIHYGRKTASFTPDVCKERLTRLSERIARIKTYLKGYEFDGLRVFLLGDVNDGTDIYKTQAHHQAQTNVEKQAHDLAALLADWLTDQQKVWKKIDVDTVPGNHGRGGRGSVHEAANWDIVAYRYLALKLEKHGIPVGLSDQDNVFMRSVTVRGHRYLLYHGHDILSSNGIPWYGMQQRLLRWQSTKRVTDFDVALMGHFHSFGMWHINRFQLLTSGTFITDDDWALQSLGWESANRTWFFGCSDHHPVTWAYGLDLR